MKKIIIYILIMINIFGSSTKISDLLKSDAEKNKSNTQGLVNQKGKIEKLVGQAFLQKDGSKSWLQLIKNTIIEEKVTIVTMENSELTIRLDKDISVNLGSKSKIYIDSLKTKPKSESLSEAGLKLLFGKLYSNINKKLETGAKYEIKSGSVVAGVRGTRFLVTNLDGGKIEIKVYDGFVIVNNIKENKEYTIMKNQKISIDEKGVTDKINEFEEKDFSEELINNDVEEKIKEIKQLINENLKTLKSDNLNIKELINEGNWKLEEQPKGNKLTIILE